MDPDLARQSVMLGRQRQPFCIATWLDGPNSGEKQIIQPHQAVEGIAEVARSCLRIDKARTIELGGHSLFLDPINPPLRLFLIGAVHISQALCPMAEALDYDVIVVDPRDQFAAKERFPDRHLSLDWPDEAMVKAQLDARSAVIALTHDPKLDDPALMIALESEAFYIGALGSLKTHAERLERLKVAGISEEQCARIHGPVGYKIGGQSPAEIAVSILAQMIEVRHRPDTT